VEITRRRLLSFVPAAGLLAVFPSVRASAVPSVRASADPVSDHATLLANTVAVFAGTAESNARPEVAAKLAAIGQSARTRLTAMDTAGVGELFKGVTLATSESDKPTFDVNLNTSFTYLYQIALATRTPGGTASELENNVTIQRRVIDGLVWLYDTYYGDQSKGYGNWFYWEIGISGSVSKTLVLLVDQIREYKPDLIQTYVASMDAYLRLGKNGDVDLDSRFHTGTNLADITTNRILQGALLGDDARITKAISDQLTVFATVDPYHLNHDVTDGYYADGSFIMHASVAYTGTYGKELLTRVVQTIKFLDGTSYATGDDPVGSVQGWVTNGFAPLIFEGWMMEIVKGRAVSRTATGYVDTATGYADVAIVVEAVVDLSGYASGLNALALKGFVKYVKATSKTALNPTSFVSPVSVVRYADIVNDASIPAKDLNPGSRSVAFNAMDKNVHRRPGYAFALARSSDRISKYEYMSGENLLPWFQGDGSHYLYLAGQDQTQAFGVDYYTTVSPYRLAGVTAPVETRHTVPELYGTQWYDNPPTFTSSSVPQNTYVYFPTGTNRFSGGATLGAYGTAGMIQSNDVAYAAKQAGLLPADFVVYRNAEATKSWFMLDDEIVVLAAGVGDQAGRAVTTTVDSRTAGASDQVTVTGSRWDGSLWSGSGTGDVRWLRYANGSQGTAVGYVFLDQQEVTVGLDKVTRSRRVIRSSNPDTAVTKNVFGVSVEQPAGARLSSLAYALVPNAGEQQLQSYAGGPLTVVRNNARVQAIKHTGLGLTAANVFVQGWQEASRLSIDGPASVIMRELPDGTTTVAVSDPTMDRDQISVIIRGRSLSQVSTDSGISVSSVPGGTLLQVNTHQAYGRSLTATLRN